MLRSEEALSALKILLDLNTSKVKATYSFYSFDKTIYHGDPTCLQNRDEAYLEAVKNIKSHEEELLALQETDFYENYYEESDDFYQGSNSNFFNSKFNFQVTSKDEGDFLNYRLEMELQQKRRNFESHFLNRQLRERELEQKEKLQKRIKTEDFTLIDLENSISALCPNCFVASKRTGYDRPLESLLYNVLSANEAIERVKRVEKIETLKDSFNLFQSVSNFDNQLVEFKERIKSNRALTDPFLIELLEPYIKLSKVKANQNVKYLKSVKTRKAFKEECVSKILKKVKFVSFNENSVYPNLDALEKTYMETLENTLNSNTKISVIATSDLRENYTLNKFTYKVLEIQYDLNGCLTILPFEIMESLEFRKKPETVTVEKVDASEFEIMKVLYSEKTHQSLKEIYEISSTI